MWIRLIKQVTTNGSVGVKVNDIEGEFFTTGKGLRQGDRFTPILFNFVVDVFAKMLIKGSEAGLIRGLCPRFTPNSVCMKEEYGGLGIPNLQDLNICMLGSWIRRYIQGEGSLWRKVIDTKCNTRSPNILCCQDIHPSSFWKGVLWAAKAVKFGYRWKVGNGRSIKFWV